MANVVTTRVAINNNLFIVVLSLFGIMGEAWIYIFGDQEKKDDQKKKKEKQGGE